MQLPELLMPAGDIQKAYYAFKYGADAIYCGLPMFSLRTRMNTFTEENLKEITEFAHKNGKKVYVTINGFPHQMMIEVLKKHLAFVETIKPDGIILADSGVLELANEFAPSVPKHLSVQSSTVNIPSMKFWMKNGVERVVLAREITLEEVKKIHEVLPKLELEFFIHGAVCMAYSGRCLLSNFTTARDANRGACAHTCRWNYRVYDENGYEVDVSDREEKSVIPAHSTSSGQALAGISCATDKHGIPDQVRDDRRSIQPDEEGEALNIHSFESKNYWEEEERQGQIVPVEEDFHGTHIMSSRDMCMIEYQKEIMDAGICSLKVEGRNKTIYYLATVARAYRKALDDVAAGKAFDPMLWEEIHATANRGFFAGFLHGKPRVDSEQYEANNSESTQYFIGVVKKWENGKILFDVKNRVDEGEEIEFVMPRIEDDFSVKAAGLVKSKEAVSSLHGGNGEGWMDCPIEVEEGILMRKKTKK